MSALVRIDQRKFYYEDTVDPAAPVTPYRNAAEWKNTATGDIFDWDRYSATWAKRVPATAVNLAAAIHAAPSKTTPIDADEVPIWNSVGSVLGKVTWANIKATLKTYFDAIYAAASHVHAQLHDRQHDVTSTDDHTFPDTPTGLFLRDDGTFAAAGGGSSWPLPEFLCTTWSSEGNVGAGFTDRQSCAMCVHDDAIYLAGGDYFTPAYYRDVYKTTDGSTWTQVASAAEFGYRTAAAMVSFGGKLVIIGGKNSGGNLTSVYSSPTGATWTQETADAGIGSVAYVTAAVFDGKIWATGGNTNTVRISSDGGATWSDASGTLAGTNNKMLVVHGDYLYNFAYLPSGGLRVIERRKAGDSSWERVYTLGAWTADDEGACVVSAGSRIFRIGGAFNPKYIYSSRLGFDGDIPINGKWRTDMSNTLPYNCAYGAAVQFRGRVYVFFGDYGKRFYSTE